VITNDVSDSYQQIYVIVHIICNHPNITNLAAPLDDSESMLINLLSPFTVDVRRSAYD